MPIHIKLALDLLHRIHYAWIMNTESNTKQSKIAPTINYLLSNTLTRLFIAGMFALVVTFALILFMRFRSTPYNCNNIAADNPTSFISCNTTNIATTSELRVEFLDLQTTGTGPTTWKVKAKFKNNGNPTKGVELDGVINNQTCSRGPFELSSGSAVSTGCTIQPELSEQGIYTMVIATDRPESANDEAELKYRYAVCQK